MKDDQLAKEMVLCPGERQVSVFRERIETAIMERLFMCFAEL